MRGSGDRRKRNKACRKAAKYYRIHFGFREPYKVRTSAEKMVSGCFERECTGDSLAQVLQCRNCEACQLITLVTSCGSCHAGASPSPQAGGNPCEIALVGQQVQGCRAECRHKLHAVPLRHCFILNWLALMFLSASPFCLLQVLLDGNFLHAMTQLKCGLHPCAVC